MSYLFLTWFVFVMAKCTSVLLPAEVAVSYECVEFCELCNAVPMKLTIFMGILVGPKIHLILVYKALDPLWSGEWLLLMLSNQ